MSAGGSIGVHILMHISFKKTSLRLELFTHSQDMQSSALLSCASEIFGGAVSRPSVATLSANSESWLDRMSNHTVSTGLHYGDSGLESQLRHRPSVQGSFLSLSSF